MNTKKTISAKNAFSETIGYIPFGEMIYSLRLTEEYSQKDFAKKLGISTSELCDIEKGRKFISIQRASIFAKKLNDSIEVFIQYVVQDEVIRAGLKCEVQILPKKSA
jgi:transcriptional regulator with XRE-family HTH domain